MFGTLKYNGTSGDPYLIETTKPPFHTQDVGKHQANACTMCREKKVRADFWPTSYPFSLHADIYV